MNVTSKIKEYLDELLPSVFDGLVSLGYDKLTHRKESYPTMGTIYVYEIECPEKDRVIEISLHTDLRGPNGCLFFRVKRLPKPEKGYIYNGLHMALSVQQYHINLNDNPTIEQFIAHLKQVEVDMVDKYSRELQGKTFKADKINYRNM